MTHDKQNSNFHRILTVTGIGLLALIIVTFIVHFAWNMAAPDLFGAPEMSFKNAFGLVILLSMFAAVFSHSADKRHLQRKQSQS